MKRFACFVIALFATIWALRAQQTIVTYTPDGVKTYDTAEPPSELLDTTQFVVSYRMLYRQRPENEHPMEDLLLLQIGRNVTKFYSYKTWQTDSLVRVTPPEQVMANLGSFHGGVQDVLFRNAAAGRLTHTDQIGMDHLLYTEPLPDCGWELTDGERTILGYACRRAACTFRGRNYEAWYAPERRLSFNEELTHNDGLLVNSVMRREGCAYDVANDIIRENVASFNKQLDEEGELSFGMVGIFKLSGRNLVFVPRRASAYEFYGMAPFTMRPLNALQAEPRRSRAAASWFAANRTYLKIAASILVLLVLSGVGDVIQPENGVCAIGSGGNYALSAARALMRNTDMTARQIAEESLKIAGEICIFTNDHITVEEV